MIGAYVESLKLRVGTFIGLAADTGRFFDVKHLSQRFDRTRIAVMRQADRGVIPRVRMRVVGHAFQSLDCRRRANLPQCVGRLRADDRIFVTGQSR